MDPRIVADASPLIGLAKIDRLVLLKLLFGEVLIPPLVFSELRAKSRIEIPRLDIAFADFLRVVPLHDPGQMRTSIFDSVDLGESHAIVLALEHRLQLLIDDRAGYQIAQQLGLSPFGTVAVLLRAKQFGHIERVGPDLESLVSMAIGSRGR